MRGCWLGGAAAGGFAACTVGQAYSCRSRPQMPAGLAQGAQGSSFGKAVAPDPYPAGRAVDCMIPLGNEHLHCLRCPEKPQTGVGNPSPYLPFPRADKVATRLPIMIVAHFTCSSALSCVKRESANTWPCIHRIQARQVTRLAGKLIPLQVCLSKHCCCPWGADWQALVAVTN